MTTRGLGNPLSQSYIGMRSVTKADADLPLWPTRALLVGSAGTADLMMEDGTTVTGVPLQAGYNPLRVRQVRNAGTASNIWALY